MKEINIGRREIKNIMLGGGSIKNIMLGGGSIKNIMLRGESIKNIMLRGKSIKNIMLGGGSIKNIMFGGGSIKGEYTRDEGGGRMKNVKTVKKRFNIFFWKNGYFEVYDILFKVKNVLILYVGFSCKDIYIINNHLVLSLSSTRFFTLQSSTENSFRSGVNLYLNFIQNI